MSSRQLLAQALNRVSQRGLGADYLPRERQEPIAPLAVLVRESLPVDLHREVQPCEGLDLLCFGDPAAVAGFALDYFGTGNASAVSVNPTPRTRE